MVVATPVAPRDAFERLQADAEPGTLDMVAELARDWFVGHFTASLTIPTAG